MGNNNGENYKPDELYLFSPEANHNDAFTLFVFLGGSN